MNTIARTERRSRRSNDTMTALHYQLAFARQQGGFDALVLADSAGVVVAGAGAWATCELLAAYAPLLAHEPTIDAPLTDVQIEKVLVDGSEVLLCARGGGAGGGSSLMQAASGCRRILGQA
jgi:hypothetical protein